MALIIMIIKYDIRHPYYLFISYKKNIDIFIKLVHYSAIEFLHKSLSNLIKWASVIIDELFAIWTSNL